MSVLTDYPDWSPHVAQAQQIAATGVPLLSKSQRLYQQAFTNLGHGATASTQALSVTQIGYQVSVTASFPAAATLPFCKVQLSWTDSALGQQVDTDTFMMPGATSPAFFIIRGRGPAKADTLTVNVTNLDSAQVVSGSITVSQNSRVYPDARWGWVNATDNGLAVPTFTVMRLPPDEGCIGILDNQSIPANTVSTFLSGMHDGPIQMSYEMNTGSAANLALRLSAQPGGIYSGGNTVYSAVNPPATVQLAGPRAPMRLQVVNSATTAIVVSVGLWRDDTGD